MCIYAWSKGEIVWSCVFLIKKATHNMHVYLMCACVELQECGYCTSQ